MGRSSSTGFPFLVCRADAGQFTYHRDVSPRLAPLVVGDLLLTWSGRTRNLVGKSTIKVSLGTGDRKTAQQRWAVVHPQIDALVQLAELRVRDPDETARPADAPRLDPAHIRVAAGQAYHDVLAADDRGHVEPDFRTPLARVLSQLSRGTQPLGSDDARIAEVAARTIERRLHKGRLLRHTTWELDKPVEESELDGNAVGLCLSGLKKDDRLGREQVDALARGTPDGVLPSEVQQRLSENGLDLPDGHLDRRALALAITRSTLRALDHIVRRDRGEAFDTPERPAAVQEAQPEASRPMPLLSAMPERWITMVRPEDKQISDSARYVRLFISVHGDLPVDQISGRHIREFRDKLLACPRNAPKHLANGSVAGLIAWAAAHPNRAMLSRETINHKALGAMSSLLEQARKDEFIGSNPAKGQQLPTKEADRQKRRPFEPEELARLFRTSVYASPIYIPAGGAGWAAWWLPLLSLVTGARLEELGQALISDVRHKHGISYIEITTLSDDETEDAGKSVKSGAARRRIPLHAILIRLGFLDYVAFIKASGATRLFPQLDEYRGRYTKNWSRWWGRWLGKLGMHDPSLTFHSFRHTFTAELRRLRCNPSILKELLGHAQTDVTSGYGRRDGYLHSLEELNEEIQRITFNGLDLSHLLDVKPWRHTA